MNEPSADEILAVARLHHAWITGLVLAVVTHEGPQTAEKLVFRLFRTQHQKRFLAGLEKLGLDQEPHAVACAKYHYFSNQLGGVKVEYFEEHERKAWVRYPPPRWIWYGPAICAIPSDVNTAMLRGWHAHNGVTLNNPNLGFVCTGTTVDGFPGLEGYYLEHDRPLAADERLQYRFDEDCPPVVATDLPVLDALAWPARRQALAYRNYAMEYVGNALPVLVELLGPERAIETGSLAAKLIAMQHYDDVAASLEIKSDSGPALAELFERLMIASGDEVERSGAEITRTRWRLLGDADQACQSIWRSLPEGLALVHNRQLKLTWSNPDSVAIS